MYRVSLSTQSLWDRGLQEAVELAARVGYDGVEIVCHDPFLPLGELQGLSESIPRKLRALNLDTAALTIVTDLVTPETVGDNVRFLKAVVGLARPYGTQIVKVSPGPPVSAKATQKQWDSAVRHLSECAAYARTRAVTLAVETHLGQLSNTLDGTRRLIQGVARPDFGVVLDWCNIMVEGGDPVAATRSLAHCIRLVHAKDARMTPDGPRWVPIGEGQMDYEALLAALDATGYSGYISVESLLTDARCDFANVSADSEEIVARELATLRRLMRTGS